MPIEYIISIIKKAISYVFTIVTFFLLKKKLKIDLDYLS